jgi:CheY-like chemotaxis protein
VACARSAAEGLRAFFANRPDVLVCDLGLPGADGYAFIRQIRELPAELGGSTGAVAVTAYAAEMPTKVLHAGFQAHLPKPVDPATLVQSVAALAFKQRQ